MIRIENHTNGEEPVNKKEIYGKDSYHLSIISLIVNPLPLLIFGLVGICIGTFAGPFLIITAFLFGLYSRETEEGRKGLFISLLSGIMYLIHTALFLMYPPYY